MHPKNRTRFKTLDRIARDDRCAYVREDSDGVWVGLANGYNFEGQSAIRGDTVASVLSDWRRVEEGEPY
jgi:hypothetical protein